MYSAWKYVYIIAFPPFYGGKDDLLAFYGREIPLLVCNSVLSRKLMYDVSSTDPASIGHSFLSVTSSVL